MDRPIAARRPRARLALSALLLLGELTGTLALDILTAPPAWARTAAQDRNAPAAIFPAPRR